MSRYDILLHQPNTPEPKEEAQASQRDQDSKARPRQRRAALKTSTETSEAVIQPASQLASQLASSQEVKPAQRTVFKGFYISDQVDRRLTEAVRYYQEARGIKKADRSVVLNALLDNEANWTEETLDLLVDRVMRQLTNRLTS